MLNSPVFRGHIFFKFFNVLTQSSEDSVFLDLYTQTLIGTTGMFQTQVHAPVQSQVFASISTGSSVGIHKISRCVFFRRVRALFPSCKKKKLSSVHSSQLLGSLKVILRGLIVDQIISVGGPSNHWHQGFMHDRLKLQTGGVQRHSIVVLVRGLMPDVEVACLIQLCDNTLTCPQQV